MYKGNKQMWLYVYMYVHALLYWRTLMDSPHFSCTSRSWPKKQYACKKWEKWFIQWPLVLYCIYLFSLVPQPGGPGNEANIYQDSGVRNSHRHCRQMPWGWGSGSTCQTVPGPMSSANHLHTHNNIIHVHKLNNVTETMYILLVKLA